jgi:hypothetical protein
VVIFRDWGLSSYFLQLSLNLEFPDLSLPGS